MGQKRRRELGLESCGIPLVGGSVSPCEDIQQSSSPRYVLSWPVSMKFGRLLGQRNTSVFAMTVKQPWKLFRLLQLHPHWYDCANGHWMIFPLTIKWDSYGSPDILVLSGNECPFPLLEGFLSNLRCSLDRLSAFCRVSLVVGLPPSCLSTCMLFYWVVPP
jgi:hypothetical protein